ncbi:MAG: protoheme IX farnesyltransferase [Gemmatimonadetes bacterium]|nr:protoheme IX farnesyltransferase [Gemmatimonadota bacterium]
MAWSVPGAARSSPVRGPAAASGDGGITVPRHDKTTSKWMSTDTNNPVRQMLRSRRRRSLAVPLIASSMQRILLPRPGECFEKAEGPRRYLERPMSAAAYYELTKPGITGYVMVTAGVSAVVAAGGALAPLTALHAVGGTGISTAGALALNQYFEREVDAVMTRTRNRPLPSGRLRPGQALVFGVGMLASGLAWLAVASGWLPATVAALSGLAYLGVYTPLKSRSYAATLAGAVPGALPTLIGWTAASGSLDSGALALFAIAYLWQLPHVLGLAWMLKDDYARVGFKLIPAGGGRLIGAHMIAATLLLVPVSLTPTLLGITGLWYLGAALAASLGFLGVAVRTARDMSEGAARKLFLASLVYHPILLGFMFFDAVRV